MRQGDEKNNNNNNKEETTEKTSVQGGKGEWEKSPVSPSKHAPTGKTKTKQKTTS